MTGVRKKWTKAALLGMVLCLSVVSYGQETNTDSLKLEVKNVLPDLNQSFFVLNQKAFKPLTPPSIMHQNAVFQANKLPIFCKIEHLLGLQSQFPVKIRLGDVDYVDNLESK